MTSTSTYLIDATAYVFRSYYSMRPIEAPDGTPINAVFGLGMTLQRLLREQAPHRVACCFDMGPVTFRNEIFPDYKANRGEPPEDLVPQFDLCRELTRRMGLATFGELGFEADDLLATLTARVRDAGGDVVVVTGDKDLAQLLEPGVRLLDLAKGEEWGHEDTEHRLGVRAEQIPDLLALAGDSIDNIPGVRGVGKVAACALLQHFADLDAIYADLDAVETLPVRGAKSLRRKLEQQRESAELSRELATVRRDVPLPVSLEALDYRGADSAELDEFAQIWGLGRVAAKVPRRENR